MRTLLGFVVAAASLVLSSGCHTRRATAEDCAALLDRVVELDMKQSGYHDRVLLAKHQAALRARFASELDACTRMALPRGAMDCVADAKSVNDITARCLR
jgi:hypothetical protein